MLADTEAIRTLSHAYCGHAADFAAAAARLSSVPSSAAAETFGPVGARFLAALAETVAEESRAVAALGDRLTAAASTASGSAAGYDDAERHAAARLSV